MKFVLCGVFVVVDLFGIITWSFRSAKEYVSKTPNVVSILEKRIDDQVDKDLNATDIFNLGVAGIGDDSIADYLIRFIDKGRVETSTLNIAEKNSAMSTLGFVASKSSKNDTALKYLISILEFPDSWRKNLRWKEIAGGLPIDYSQEYVANRVIDALGISGRKEALDSLKKALETDKERHNRIQNAIYLNQGISIKI